MRHCLALWFLAGILVFSLPADASVPNIQEFAPQEGLVSAFERPFRDEQSLNGRWQFQPMRLPDGYVRDKGTPPVLPPPNPTGWDNTPIKIPSFWNVNTWGGGRNIGEGTPHPYWPGSVTYPSYPASWDGVEMGWLRRTVRVPANWRGKRLLLHFEAVAGDCQILINGTQVGGHFDSYTPFEIDVTSQLKPGVDNKLLVGVRHHRLFNKTDARYPHFRTPYPNGSNTDQLVGIWQDVFLIAVSPVHVADAFVKPLVSQDRLEAEVTLTNASTTAQKVSLGGSIAPWVNLAGKSVEDAPVPKGKLATPVLSFPSQLVTVPAGGSVKITLQTPVKGRLKLWSPATPNLNGFVLSVAQSKTTIVDKHYTRFGWRQITINGQYVQLNGKKIQLFGDLVHPFGTFTMSRRYAWAWYRMVKDFGGNTVRIHAQPMPSFYLDLADEMGLMVLDETALFGSSLALNFDEPIAWTRFAEHYDGLVLRDRNHPSVFGWSFGNELFAIFSYNKIPEEQTKLWYAQLTELGMRSKKLDPTRDFITCDGDEDLRGTLPVWSKHFGATLPKPDQIPDISKPRVVGESGGTYYAKPPRMVEFNGDRAYESYTGRNEALAIDVYENVTKMARPKLAFFSASETVWFGLEHLPYGYNDFSRLPNAEDGILFTKPYVEGKPGWQPERLPPYVATLNPDWDPSLPLYKPLPMFDALKAALAPNAPVSSPWDHKMVTAPPPALTPPTIESASFIGPRDGNLYTQLTRWGVPFANTDGKMLIIDGVHLASGDVAATKQRMDAVLKQGGVALILVGDGEGSLDNANSLLPAPIERTKRQATMLMKKDASPWTAPLGMADLYFAENAVEKQILKSGLSGPFVAQGKILLEAANIDWTLFDAGENVKCGALVLYEHLKKPSGAVLVIQKQGGGTLAVSSLDTTAVSMEHTNLWRKLLTGLGLRLGEARPDKTTDTSKEHDLLRDGPPVPGKSK